MQNRTQNSSQSADDRIEKPFFGEKLGSFGGDLHNSLLMKTTTFSSCRIKPRKKIHFDPKFFLCVSSD